MLFSQTENSTTGMSFTELGFLIHRRNAGCLFEARDFIFYQINSVVLMDVCSHAQDIGYDAVFNSYYFLLVTG